MAHCQWQPCSPLTSLADALGQKRVRAPSATDTKDSENQSCNDSLEGRKLVLQVNPLF